MADKLLRAQVSIPLDSGVPEDAIVNTWHFDGDDLLQPANDGVYHNSVMGLLTAFYQSIDGVVFAQNVGSPATVKIYDMRDPEERQVEFTGTIDLQTTTDPPLPNEVALCLSFSADYESGVNPQRRRGRVFLGPVSTGAVSIINSQSRPSAAVRQAVADAAEVLMAGDELVFGDPERMHWAIYSRVTDAAGDIGLAFNDVTGGWVDDAFDTQRRRGAAPTARILF